MEKEVLDRLLFLKEMEYSIHKEDENVEKIIVWVPFGDIDEFVELFPSSNFDEDGMKVHLKEDCIALDIKEQLEYFLDDEELGYIIKKLEQWQ